MNLTVKFSETSGITLAAVNKTIELLQDGASIPFIARYRKEHTGFLNETQIRDIYDFWQKIQKIEERREELKVSFNNYEGLSESLKSELHNKLDQCESMQELEAIYEPYKRKKANKALVAREQGLDKALDLILSYSLKDMNQLSRFIDPSKNLNNINDVYAGLEDLLNEKLSLDTIFRSWLKELIIKFSFIVCKKAKAEDTENLYSAYYDSEWKTSYIPDWRIMAINRAEKAKIINVKIEPDKEKILEIVFKNTFSDKKTSENFYEALASKAIFMEKISKNLIAFEFIIECYKTYIKKSLIASIERDIRNDLTDNANERSIRVFQKNLKALLMTPPLSNKNILALDPGFRTGCKCALVDADSNLVYQTTIYPIKLSNHSDESSIIKAKETIKNIYTKYTFDLIAIGNGTASKETESFISDFIKEYNVNVNYLIVSEAGASVYSASQTAIDEFPDLDVSIRGAVSIGRRVQNMLDELVKIPPESIGVGMYQHDVPEKELAEKLKIEVESVVNTIGVDLNRASVYLLQYVSGLNMRLAKEIVKYRNKNKMFKNRDALKQVKGIGDKIFELCAGFCKVYESDNLLDKTTVHPESYDLVYQVIDLLELRNDLESFLLNIRDLEKAKKIEQKFLCSYDLLNRTFSITQESLKELTNNLLYSSAENLYLKQNKPEIRTGVNSISVENLISGSVVQGIVRNVTDFGIFIDIGLKNDALMYASVCKNNELNTLQPGQLIKAEVISITKQISTRDSKESYKIGLKPV